MNFKSFLSLFKNLLCVNFLIISTVEIYIYILKFDNGLYLITPYLQQHGAHGMFGS